MYSFNPTAVCQCSRFYLAYILSVQSSVRQFIPYNSNKQSFHHQLIKQKLQHVMLHQNHKLHHPKDVPMKLQLLISSEPRCIKVHLHKQTASQFFQVSTAVCVCCKLHWPPFVSQTLLDYINNNTLIYISRLTTSPTVRDPVLKLKFKSNSFTATTGHRVGF